MVAIANVTGEAKCPQDSALAALRDIGLSACETEAYLFHGVLPDVIFIYSSSIIAKTESTSFLFNLNPME